MNNLQEYTFIRLNNGKSVRFLGFTFSRCVEKRRQPKHYDINNAILLLSVQHSIEDIKIMGFVFIGKYEIALLGNSYHEECASLAISFVSSFVQL